MSTVPYHPRVCACHHGRMSHHWHGGDLYTGRCHAPNCPCPEFEEAN